MCKRAELSCISFSKHVCTHRLCTSRRGGCTCSDFGTVTLQTLLNSKLSAREAVQHWFCLCQCSCTGVKEQTKCCSRPTLHIPKQVMGVVTARHDASDILLHKAGTPSTWHYLYFVSHVHVDWGQDQHVCLCNRDAGSFRCSSPHTMTTSDQKCIS